VIITNSYDYDLDHVTAIAYENFGRFYMGKGVVNVVKSYTTTITGQPAQTRFNDIAFDSKNRESSVKSKDGAGNVSQTVTYTYY